MGGCWFYGRAFFRCMTVVFSLVQRTPSSFPGVVHNLDLRQRQEAVLIVRIRDTTMILPRRVIAQRTIPLLGSGTIPSARLPSIPTFTVLVF